MIRNSHDLEDLLKTVLQEQDPENVPELDDTRVSTFAEDGLLTRNAGLVLTFPSGASFQLSIIQATLPALEPGDERAD